MWTERFHDLMPYRIHDVLLVSSDYDAYVIEEDGRLSDRFLAECSELNLLALPRLIHVSTAAEALKKLEQRRFDLVLTTMRLEDPGVRSLSVRVKLGYPTLPVVLLVLDEFELRRLYSTPLPTVDRVFLWTGDTRIMLALTKLLEDALNVEEDTRAGVQAIIVVEDSVRRYSTFLAMLYSELLLQSQTLVAEGVNAAHRVLRMRARPKILLATNYEEAQHAYQRYRDHVLAVITDVQFPREGQMDEEAGFRLLQEVRADQSELPVFIQSANPDAQARAWEVGAHYADKNSPTLLREIRTFFKETLGFGDFVFRLPDRTEIARARDMYEMERILLTVDPRSLHYHAAHNHLNVWLRARSMFDLADRVEDVQVQDFPNLEDMRAHLVGLIRETAEREEAGVVADFASERVGATRAFVKVGQGSIGGKGRSIAFLNHLLASQNLQVGSLAIRIPRTVVLATDEFDRYLETHGLDNVHAARQAGPRIKKRFMGCDLHPELLAALRTATRSFTGPLAVRSSSLLEDSQHQSCAGIYETVLVPNNQEDLELRLAALSRAVRSVYASTFSNRARAYLETTPFSMEEERMAIVIQELVGSRHGPRFYPDISGVALSYNFYPVGPQEPEEGVVLLALGLGHTIVQGGRSVRFCPRHPKVVPYMDNPSEFLKYSQTDFYAVDLERSFEEALQAYDLSEAERDGTLAHVGSVYSHDDDQLRENLRLPGRRVVTFNNLLKWNSIPLAESLDRVLGALRRGVGSPVEIEFAVDLSEPCLYLLQVRPLSEPVTDLPVSIEGYAPDSVLAWSPRSMGHGVVSGLADVLWVECEDLEPSRTESVAVDISRYNAALAAEKRPYLLIGPGRWGSSDPSLGIPVGTTDITGARAILELPFADREVEPSVGSHFFHELTSMRVGYLYVPRDARLDREWLGRQEPVSRSGPVVHLCFQQPLAVVLDGRRRQALVLKPGATPAPASEE
ncbi:MAG: PEP/pyruvate-binding domain-containing protein [Candidatus Eremiobacterota bacterium]